MTAPGAKVAEKKLSVSVKSGGANVAVDRNVALKNESVSANSGGSASWASPQQPA